MSENRCGKVIAQSPKWDLFCRKAMGHLDACDPPPKGSRVRPVNPPQYSGTDFFRSEVQRNLKTY